MDGSSRTFGLSGFFAWWGEELYGLLPGAGARTGAALPRLTLAIEPDGLRIAGRHAGGIGSGPAPEATLPVPAMLAYLAGAKAKSSARTIGLRLPYAACFTRQLELPAVARRDFSRLLELDLERSTPFKTKDVFTDYTVSGSPNAKGLLKIQQVIIKRRVIEGLKSQIEALGYAVTRADCAAEDGAQALPVNFLAAPPIPGSARATGTLPVAMGIVAIALMASAAYLYIDRHEQALQSLQTEINTLKLKASSQKEALVKSQAAFANIENYYKLKHDTVSKVLLLEELTRLLPDSAWVTDLKMDSTTLEIAGLAGSSTALIPLLERSSAFMDATSTASLTFDPREEKERYAIRARIRTLAPVPSRVEGGGP